MSNFKGWEIVIILVLLLLLFGAKRLPDAARGLGRSLRIFKSETKGLRDDDRDGSDDAARDTTPRELERGPEPHQPHQPHQTSDARESAAPKAADPEARER